jgi:hypothetical protein
MIGLNLCYRAKQILLPESFNTVARLRSGERGVYIY